MQEETSVNVEESNAAGSAATESNTGAAKRGRPKGSKNKVSADARALLAKHGLSGLRMLCTIAAGRPVWRQRKDDRGREKLTPDLDQMLTAQKALLDRLVPALKATEISGPDGGPIETNAGGSAGLDYSPRDVARAIFGVLRDAKLQGDEAGATVAVAAPGESLLRIRDPDLARKVLPSHSPAQDALAEPRRVSIVGEDMRPTGYHIEQRFDGPRGRERWACLNPEGGVVGHANSFDEARQQCLAQAAVGAFKTRDQLPTDKLQQLTRSGS